MQQCIKIFIIPYLYEARHVSGDTPPIIQSLKLHWQPLVFHTWKVVGHEDSARCQAQYVQQCIKIFIIPYLYEAQHVSGDTPPIIRSLKPHWQPLIFHMQKVVGHVDGGCQAQYVPDNVHHLHVQQSFTYEKPEAASAVLGS
jgi:hypothetical protein